MKRLISISIAIILAVSLLSGCTKKNETSTSGSPITQGENITGTATDSSSQTSTEQQGTQTPQPSADNTTQTQQQAQTTDNGTQPGTNTQAPAKSTNTTGSKGTTSAGTPAKPTVSVNTAVEGAVKYILASAAKNSYKIGDWDAIALKISGYDVDSSQYKKDSIGYIENRATAIGRELENYYLTDYSRTILGVMSAGYDPSIFEGIKLVDMIKGSVSPNGKFMDTIKGGEDLLNCHVWSMIAMEASSTAYDKESALKYIETKQNKDGGFYIFSQYPLSDTDFTSMTVVAQTMAGRDKNSPSVSKALAYLKDQLRTMEKKPALESAETLSVILEAAVSAKDDVKSYKINGKNIVDELLSFRNSDGGFMHLKGGMSNDIATRQVLTALQFYKNAKNMYSTLKFEKGKYYANADKTMSQIIINNAVYNSFSGNMKFAARLKDLDDAVLEITDGVNTYTSELKPENGIIALERELPMSNYRAVVKGRKNGSIAAISVINIENVKTSAKVKVRVEGYKGTVLSEKYITVGNKRVFDYDGTAYETPKVSVYAAVLSALFEGGIPSQASYSWGAPYLGVINGIAGGVFGGWDGWMYYVNGKDPSVGMTDAEIKDGDEILLYYGDWGIRPLDIIIPADISAGQSFDVVVKSDEKPIAGATVYVNGKSFITDDLGIAKVMVEKGGSVEIYAEKNDKNGKPEYIRSKRSVTEIKK